MNLFLERAKQRKINIVVAIMLCSVSFVNGQNLIEISGEITNADDVEGIHIINKNSNTYATVDAKGKFVINVKLNDTLLVSSIKYFARHIPIDAEILKNKQVSIKLEEMVNNLDEVLVGKILTGNLDLDLDITTTKRDIDFYDVGIPGNTNLPITQNERRLFEADAGKFLYFYGIGFAVNVNKILNRVSGRTRQLKEFVALDERDNCMESARLRFQEVLFPENEFPKEICFAFFFFASEDSGFKNICLLNNDMAMLTFLEDKKIQFLKNLNSAED